jgi:hypothetical protein
VSSGIASYDLIVSPLPWQVLDSVANHIFHDYAENAHGLEVPKTVSDFCKR